MFSFIAFVYLTFFAFSIKISHAQVSCMDSPYPYKYSSASVCNSPHILDSNLPSFPTIFRTGATLLTFDLAATIISVCPGIIDNIELFSLTINKPNDGSLLQISRVYYQQSTSYYHFSGSFGGTVRAMKDKYKIFQPGDSFQYFMKISLETTTNNARGTLALSGYYDSATVSLDIPTPIQFDSTTRFFFCTDTNGVTNAYCQITGFSTWYAFEDTSNGFSYTSGLFPTPIAFYQFNQETGNTVQDSYNNLAAASLGTDPTTAPQWNSNKKGIVFTSSNQYMTLPTFPLSSYNSFQSLSLSFWIRISTGSSGIIFQYSSSDVKSPLLQPSITLFPKLQSKRLSLILNPDHSIIARMMGSTTSTNGRTVPVDTWSLITAFYVFANTAISSYMSVYIDTNSFGYFYNSVTSLPITATDKVLLGPFTNPTVSIYNIKIFSPGAYSPRSIRKFSLGEISYLFKATCSTPTTLCSLTLGAPNIGNCLTCQSGAYMKNFNCLRECYIYSDTSCKMQCAYPYIPRNETLSAYCDFRCASNQFLYPDGSCLPNCPTPAVKYQNLTNEWYCRGPCEDASKFYYPDQKVCLASCSENYDEDYSIFYKRCILTKVSETIKSTIEATEKAGTASRAITQATTALSSGSPTGISTSIAGKIFSNIKYLNISYSVALQEALLTWKSNFINLEFMPDMPESIQDNIISQPVPYMFEKYNVHSSFLLNFWNNLLLLVFIVLLFTGIKVFEHFIKLKKLQEKVIVLRAMVQNFLISQLYSVYGDILFYSTIEYRSIEMKKGLTGLSFTSAVLLTCIIIASLILHFLFLKKYQRTKLTNPEALEKFIKSHEGNFVLFRDFKDRLLIQQSFLLLLTARDLACSLIITTIFHHPLAQSIIILILNLLMIAYLILRNPFVSLFDYIQQFFYEFITLTVSVNVLILAIMDAIASVGKKLRINIGNFIIITNLCFNFGALGFMLIKGWFLVKEIYDNYKAKKQLNKSLKIKHQRPESFSSKDSSLSLSEKSLTNSSLIKSSRKSKAPFKMKKFQKKEDNSNFTPSDILQVADLEISSPDLQRSRKRSFSKSAFRPENETSKTESVDHHN